MGKQFRLYISHLDAHIEGSAAINLPAGPYGLRDALDKVRLSKDERVLLEMDSCRCPDLMEWFNGRESGHDTIQDIYRLNVLAEQMEKLEIWQMPILAGALRMEAREKPQLPLSRLCDLAEALDSYNFAGASDDEELGEFYVENGFLPELENVPESVLEKLDFEKIGREMRETEGGTFVEHGYVVRSGDIPEKHKGLDLTPPEPEYTILLEVGLPDRGEPELLKLPCSSEALRAIPDRFEARGWCDLTWRCADCKIPSLRDTISTCESILEINTAAEVLEELSGIELLTSKALVSVMKPQDLTDALALIEARNDYALERDIASPADVGMSRLQSALQQDEIELLAPHVNLYSYGESAMKLYGMELTEYGGLERWDGQPVHAPEEEHAQTGGMEMR